MDMYKQRAFEEILKYLKYNDNQLDLIGRVFSMEEDKELVRFVELKSCEDYINSLFGPIICLDNERKVNIRVVLQNKLYDEKHEILEERVKNSLYKAGIDTTDLF